MIYIINHFFIHKMAQRVILVGVLIFCSYAQGVEKNILRIAVASNFHSTLEKLVTIYSEQSKVKLEITSSSSGKLFGMIKNGAPFDIFLSADDIKTKVLVSENLALTSHVYAYGRLAIYWSIKLDVIGNEEGVVHFLQSDQRYKIALPNTKLAPYGEAAQNWLMKNKIWPKVKDKLVITENVSQSFLVTKTGNAQLGFVALSHLLAAKVNKNQFLIILSEDKIKQELVVLKKSSMQNEALKFVQFLKTQLASDVMTESGYLAAILLKI